MFTKLILFDIDGTLLTAGRKAWEGPFGNALAEVVPVPLRGAGGTGRGRGSFPIPPGYSPAGKTDAQIIVELLAAAGVPEREALEALPTVRERYLARLAAVLDAPGSVTLKPGVPELLDRLAAETGALLGILTGNFEEGARLKLTAGGIAHSFRVGAFGDGALRRRDLPVRALAAARAFCGIDFRGKDVVVVGDTPHDVDCGRPLGVRTVAVATGGATYAALQACRPDFLFEDFRDTERVLEALLRPLPGRGAAAL